MLAEANLSRTVQSIEPGAGFICTMYEFQGIDRETNSLDVVYTSDYMDVLSSMSRSDLIQLSLKSMHALWTLVVTIFTAHVLFEHARGVPRKKVER